MSYLADHNVWIVADNSPLADRCPDQEEPTDRVRHFRTVNGKVRQLFSLMRTRSLSATAARELWLLATITSGFTGKLRNAGHRSPTTGRSATARPLNSGNTSTRSRSHATQERFKGPNLWLSGTQSFSGALLRQHFDQCNPSLTNPLEATQHFAVSFRFYEHIISRCAGRSTPLLGR